LNHLRIVADVFQPIPMESLSPIDLQKLNCSIHQLYTLDNAATFGVAALRIVDQLVPGDIPMFSQLDMTQLVAEDTYLLGDSGLSPEFSILRMQSFAEHPNSEHLDLGQRAICKVSDFISRDELHGREQLYQKFFRPLGFEDQMTIIKVNNPPSSGRDWGECAYTEFTGTAFFLHRDRRSFTERDRQILTLLRPHLFQAHCNVQKYQQLAQQARQVTETFSAMGLITLTADGQANVVTTQAAAWLDQYFTPATVPGSLPEALTTWMTAQISQIRQGDHRVPSGLPLSIEQANCRLVVRLILAAMGDGYSLLLEEQHRNGLPPLEGLNLSRRETEVLSGLLQGKDNKAIGKALNVATGTIRKHLENIYRKLNVQSRAEAVALALDHLGIIEAN
jgi:DNA-binding NarL/FixJ family response regulator